MCLRHDIRMMSRWCSFRRRKTERQRYAFRCSVERGTGRCRWRPTISSQLFTEWWFSEKNTWTYVRVCSRYSTKIHERSKNKCTAWSLFFSSTSLFTFKISYQKVWCLEITDLRFVQHTWVFSFETTKSCPNCDQLALSLVNFSLFSLSSLWL